MTYLLDTNVISELRKSRQRAHPAVRSWATDHAHSHLFLSVVTILEVEVGIARIQRTDPAQADRLSTWLDDVVLSEFAGRILPVDLMTARRAARLHVPDPRPERDALIAATAMVHGLTIVTRNVSDFEPMGVAVVNPWSA